MWHLQYTDWPDHGCPDDMYGFLGKFFCSTFHFCCFTISRSAYENIYHNNPKLLNLIHSNSGNSQYFDCSIIHIPFTYISILNNLQNLLGKQNLLVYGTRNYQDSIIFWQCSYFRKFFEMPYWVLDEKKLRILIRYVIKCKVDIAFGKDTAC